MIYGGGEIQGYINFPNREKQVYPVNNFKEVLEVRARKRDAMILEAAMQELMWDVGDPRHGRWKQELCRRLWAELGIDWGVYT